MYVSRLVARRAVPRFSVEDVLVLKPRLLGATLGGLPRTRATELASDVNGKLGVKSVVYLLELFRRKFDTWRRPAQSWLVPMRQTVFMKI